MANDRKIKDAKGTTPKKRLLNAKDSSTSGSSAMDASSLRRSTRETASKKQMISSPSNTRKSERLEKRTTNTSPVKKPARLEKQRMPSPLKRNKRNSLSGSSGSKGAEKGFSSADMKEKKLKSVINVKQSTPKAKEVNRSEKHDLKPVSAGKKRMDARTYKALFKPQRRRGALQDISEELERRDKLSQVDGSISGTCGSKQVEDGDEECREEIGKEGVERNCEGTPRRTHCTSGNFDQQTLENHEVKFSYSSLKHISVEEHCELLNRDGLNASGSDDVVRETCDDAKRMEVDFCEEELQDLDLMGSTSIRNSFDDDNDLGSDDKVTPATRKRSAMEMDSNASARVSNKDNCMSIADVVSSPPSVEQIHDYVATCTACCKRQRVSYDSPKQELCACKVTLNKDQCETPIRKDRGGLEANIITGFADKCDGNTEQESPLETDSHQNICAICMLGGKLLCCDGKGCNRSCHLLCIDPHMNDVQLGALHCPWCVNKKIESGVHSVSKGMESIWDAREVEMRDTEGLKRQKQYLVKYKGLAHIHNHWVPETQLQFEAPMVLAKFNRKNQVLRWKKDWTVPHRLLKKRLLMFPMHPHFNDSGRVGDALDCRYEWLVKWCGLGYEHATWELENASFLQSPLAQRLMKVYENRHKNSKRAAFLSQIDKSKKKASVKLSKLPAGFSPGIDNNYLSSINKLREYWHQGQHAVIMDDKDRVMKMILFVQSLLPDICQPFLIISTLSALSSWESGFLHMMPSIDVVTYNGNEETRKSIRSLEFYEEGGCIMFEVLLSTPEAVVEDFEMLECIRWEAIIIDECQSSRISTHFEQIKMFTTDARVLLYNGQIRDSIAEHLNLLSLLDSSGDLDACDVLETDSNNDLAKLKKRLSRFTAYDCKSGSSKFVEYWVPVQISNLQLEQYCATLISNSFSLRSTSKSDSVGALSDILLSLRKCCNHPYIVDPSLQGLITKNLPEIEYLDVGIKASGKLQLLDMMLSEMKNQQLRAVILFQSFGGKDTIGDILDDFLRQRFGPDSYERLDGGGLMPSRKQAALSKFNDKDSGRFVFLLENRACLPSIKLVSVDAIVIFDSDWNPTNDLRALHKITIDSQLEQIKVFRLYSLCTVEEKALILAKHDLDNNLQSISRMTSHMLLMWGASYLFNKLDAFHGCSAPDVETSMLSEGSLLKDVAKQFLPLLSQNASNNDAANSIILEVKQNGGTYNRNISLLGQLKFHLTDEEEPHVFWTRLFEGRNPRWKYLSEPGQRNRKRVQYFVESPKRPEVETGEEVGKKRKKVENNCVDPAFLKPGEKQDNVAVDKEGASGILAYEGSESLPRSTACLTDTLDTNHVSSTLFSYRNITTSPEIQVERAAMYDAQKSLHVFLKSEISKLSDILQLPGDVKVMVGRFLEYVIDNHHVGREPATLLQAFQLSLCWIAASLLEYKIDKKDSLLLAKRYLNFDCKEGEANKVYARLRLLKKKFLQSTDKLKESDSSKGSVSAAEDITKELLDARVSQSVASCKQDIKLEVEDRLLNHEVSVEHAPLQLDQAPKRKMEEKEVSKHIKRRQKKCDKRMKILIRKQQEETQEFNRGWEEKREQLEKEHRLESALVRSIHAHLPVRMDKLKILDRELVKKLEDHKQQKEKSLIDLRAKQLAERNEERQKEGCFLAKQTSLVQVELSGDRASVAACQQSSRVPCPTDGLTNVDPLNQLSSVEQIPVSSIQNQVVPSELPEIVPNEVVGLAGSAEMLTSAVESSRESDRKDGSDTVPNATRNQNHASGRFINRESLCVVPSLESNRANERAALQIVELDTIANAIVQNNAAGSSINGNSVSVDLPLIQPPSVQPVISPVQGGQSSQDVALQDCSCMPTSIGMRDGDAPQVEVASLLPVDTGATAQDDHEEPVVEPIEHLQSSLSNNIPHDRSQPDLLPLLRADLQPCCEAYTSSQNAEVPLQLDRVPAELSNQDISQSSADLTPLPSVSATHLHPSFSQSESNSGSRVNCQPSGEGGNSFQDNVAAQQLVEHTAELPNPVLQPPGVSLGPHPPVDTHISGFGTHSSMHISPQMTSRMSTSALYGDPLQNELERLRKETEQAIKVHEDMKLHLKLECDKEIEVITAQIRNKYQTKLQDVEAEFHLKKKELDTNHSIVLMNKILAEVFRSKCLDIRRSGALGIQQVAPCSSMHHLTSAPTCRISSVSGSSLAASAAPNQQALPPVQVHHSSATFSAVSARSPHISLISPPAGNAQLGEIRAPAPHLQPFRPSASTSTASIPSLPRAFGGHHTPTNLPMTSSGYQLSPAPYPSAPSYRSPPSEIAGGFPALLHSSLPALELLMDVDNRAGVRLPNLRSPLPDRLPNFDYLNLADFGTSGSTVSRPGVASDVVCLSDDE